MNNPDGSNPTETSPLNTGAEDALLLARAAKRQVFLVVHHRNGVEAVHLPSGVHVVVGREPPADIVIPDKNLSRRHAQFSRALGESVTVEDLGSTNGTRVGAQRIEQATLSPGDEVKLGSIVASIHVVVGGEVGHLGLAGHDAFRRAVEAEIARSRFFGRPLALLMVQPPRGHEGHLPRWSSHLRTLVRPIDNLALYGANALEILLPEAGPELAAAIGQAIVARRDGEPPLTCGLASFPEAGSTADDLIEASRDAVRRADAATPLCAAADRGLRTFAPEPPPDARALSSSASAASDASDASGASGASVGDADELIAMSPAMREAAVFAARLSRSSLSVLLRGETGSGKEVLARRIHGSGPRREKPLIALNCGAIPGQLVEGALFGHEKGAFTGAIQQQKGVFEAADGGTVLLDEIGELPLSAQTALLRVLETKRVVRVGATREIPVDIRVIAATHRDLVAMTSTGAFRLDLYYRLSAIVLEVPPLRERREDIGPLAARFLRRAALAEGSRVTGIDPEAMELLVSHAWPGNVRELRNAVERAVFIADGEQITPGDLPESIRVRGNGTLGASPQPTAPVEKGSLKERMERFERDTILEALRLSGGHQPEAARRLDVPLRTLQHKVRGYGFKKVFGIDDEPTG